MIFFAQKFMKNSTFEKNSYLISNFYEKDIFTGCIRTLCF